VKISHERLPFHSVRRPLKHAGG